MDTTGSLATSPGRLFLLSPAHKTTIRHLDRGAMTNKKMKVLQKKTTNLTDVVDIKMSSGFATMTNCPPTR